MNLGDTQKRGGFPFVRRADRWLRASDHPWAPRGLEGVGQREGLVGSRCYDFNVRVCAKIKPPGDRRFQSMFPFTWVPFWVHIFDPQP